MHLEDVTASDEAVVFAAPSNSDKEPLDTFHFFPKLPTELRLKIWSLAPDARVVEAIFCEEQKAWYYPWESHHRPGALLSTNRESREQCLKQWFPFLRLSSRKAFNSHCAHTDTVQSPITYFNPKVDTLYINQFNEDCFDTGPTPLSYSQLLTKMEYMKDLRHLCVEFDNWGEHGWVDKGPAYNTLRASPRAYFPSLELFIIVPEDELRAELSSGMRREGVVELEDPSEEALECASAQDIRGFYKYFYIENPKVGYPLWAIKTILRGGRQIEDSFYISGP